MLSPSRIVGLLLALVLLTACQFQPVYGPGSPATVLRGQVAVASISGRTGFELTARLRQLLDEGSGSGTFTLITALSIETETYGTSTGGSTTRIALDGTAAFTVSDTAGTGLYSDSVSEIVSFDNTGSEVANRTSRRNAEDQLAHALAEKIVDAINGSAGHWLP